jgi:hypothetical protein
MAAMAPRRPIAAQEAARASRPILAQRAAATEKDGRDEEACHGRPGEGV